jgi:predicted dehydrogenase
MDRREFFRTSIGAAAALAVTQARPAVGNVEGPAAVPQPDPARPRLRFAAIGLNHSHINGQVDAVTRGGGQLVAFHAKEPDLAAAFQKRHPSARAVPTEREILEDVTIPLVLSASIPDERARLGIAVMRHGKDFMVDKPGATSLEQLAEVRRVQAETKRIYSVLIERHESPSTQKAGALVAAGAIGRVIQTVALAPHRMAPATRPPWFFERARYGGILCDLASHHVDQFVFFTGATRADVVAAQVGNVHHPQYPGVEDFGDVMLRGDGGTGYIRADWFTPDGLGVFGDGRTTILGTEGYIEIRKSVDIAGRAGGNHLFLVDHKGAQYVDCRDVALPYGARLVDDVLNRTQTADDQSRTFLAMELALRAERDAQRVTSLRG